MFHILQSLKNWSLYLYSPPDSEKTARLPRESDAQRKRERERILSAVVLDVALHRDIVLQAWLREETDVRRQVILQAKTEGGRELPRCADGSLVAGLILTIHIEVRPEG